AQRGVAFATAFAMPAQQFAGERGFAILAIGRRRVDQRQRELQALADALAQFLGGRVGEGDGEDFADAQPPLHHQPRDQGGEGVGLAGAGAGLDQAHAVQRQVEVGIAGGVAHAASSAWSSGKAASPMSIAAGTPRTVAPNTMPATRANSRSDAASANGSRPRRASRSASASPSAQPPLPLPRHVRAALPGPVPTFFAPNSSRPL